MFSIGLLHLVSLVDIQEQGREFSLVLVDQAFKDTELAQPFPVFLHRSGSDISDNQSALCVNLPRVGGVLWGEP